MKLLKKIYADVVARILDNPKSSVAGIMAAVLYVAAVYGFEVPQEIIAAISSILLVLVGLLKKD